MLTANEGAYIRGRAVHAADAFRYLSVGWRVIPEKQIERPKPLFPLPGGGVIAPPLPSVRR